MKNKKESAIDRFLNVKPTEKKEKEKFIMDGDGLIVERIDKILITRDGKQLLREQY